GMALEKVEKMLVSIAAAAEDEEAEKRAEAAEGTKNRIDAGEETTGWPKLSELVGEEVVDVVRSWLGDSMPLARCGPSEPTENSNTNLKIWPVLSPVARYGLAGDIVEMIEPHTEADPSA